MLQFSWKTVRNHLIFLSILGLLCIWGCPLRRLTGISCPGCGLTRAWLSFLKGQWNLAISYHLFFLPTPFFLFLFAHSSCYFEKNCSWIRSSCFCFFSLLFIYHLCRLWLFHILLE
ncbi:MULTISPECIES: DUF2752 domain-containing protein [Intestinimonas]|uniref:DUF2752 domain-containing protein n=1 Tax=Intestinimonas TaxID=1392389 RepID=UPI00195D2992|nr:DUF2752 domain-containing protein [Intestinimonas butyriciproducens]MBU5433524.1 DUF2752 domain-containing protein [Intestinimonas sp. MSJ-38]